MGKVYVNHKAVPMDDESLSTHAKASQLFLDNGWSGANVITLSGSNDAAAEAELYAQKLRELPETKLPRDEDGAPIFDLMLIGVGDDGHVSTARRAASCSTHACRLHTPGDATCHLPDLTDTADRGNGRRWAHSIPARRRSTINRRRGCCQWTPSLRARSRSRSR